MTTRRRSAVWGSGALALGLFCWLASNLPAVDSSCIGAIPCYESPGFTLRVIDKETGHGLADVHALAEWINYGMWGQKGPVMVQDAVSGSDGLLVFPAWGPTRGYEPGPIPQLDPVITLFKVGYLLPHPDGGGARLLYNRPLPQVDERTRVRRFANDGGTVSMEPFRGTLDEWVQQLNDLAFPPTGGGVATSDARRRFGIFYLNRRQRVRRELDKLPQERRDVRLLIQELDRNLRKLMQGE